MTSFSNFAFVPVFTAIYWSAEITNKYSTVMIVTSWYQVQIQKNSRPGAQSIPCWRQM